MSRLLDKHSPELRRTNMSRNSYNDNDEYQIGHSRAISDGDEWGKDEFNGSVGGLTDIKTRERLVAKTQPFNMNRPYDSSTA